MLAILIAAIVTAFVAYLIIKKCKTQFVLFLGGLILMAFAILLHTGPLLPAKQSSGFIWFDLFRFIENTFSTGMASLGLLLMSVAGFSQYMDHIGASKALVRLCTKPLSKLHAPYFVLALSYIVGEILGLFIPSAAGLGMLLMVTMFPILLDLGVSRLSATAVIVTTYSISIGPGSANTNLAAKIAGIDVSNYFIQYQIPVAVTGILIVAVLHYFVQKWFDKKDGHDVTMAAMTQLAATSDADAAVKDDDTPPAIYALLPVIPLVLILGFSGLVSSKIKVGVPSAMFMGIFLAIIFEFIRYRDIKKVFAGGQTFFDGMGKMFATVITLIVAGQTFAQGLTSIGAIDTLIQASQSLGFGVKAMTVVMTGIISVAAVLMGSGNAPFFAFAALAPTVAAQLGANPVLMLLPMQLASGIMRSVSPITAVVVAASGVANVSPFDVVKRTAIPMIGALIVTLFATFIML